MAMSLGLTLPLFGPFCNTFSRVKQRRSFRFQSKSVAEPANVIFHLRRGQAPFFSDHDWRKVQSMAWKQQAVARLFFTKRTSS
jgi:hypothetical protein